MAEVYGPDHEGQIDLALRVRDEVFARTPGVVDVDWYVEAPRRKLRFVVDREKCALSGVTPQQVTDNLRVASEGGTAGLAHMASEREDVPIRVQLPIDLRSSSDALKRLHVCAGASTVPLSELVRVEETVEPPYIYRKNLRRVVYVTSDVAGEEESPVYAILKLDEGLAKLRDARGRPLEVYYTRPPSSTKGASVKWDGNGTSPSRCFATWESRSRRCWS